MLGDETAYLSSTYEDLKGIRIKVRDKLTRLGIKVVGMEDYCASEERPLDRCLEDVRSCQLYIGLFGDRYGYVPAGMTKSITELEYETAGKEGIERLIFLIDFPDWVYDHDRGERIIELRKKVSTDHVVKQAKSVDELLLQITDAILDWQKKRSMRHTLPPESTLQVFLSNLRRKRIDFYRYYVPLRGILRTAPPKIKEDDELWPSTLSAVAPPSPGPANIVALEKVELALSSHCQLLVVGRGGCGKTTFSEVPRANGSWGYSFELCWSDPPTY